LGDQPRTVTAMRVKVAGLAHLGQLDEARAELGRVLAIAPKLTHRRFSRVRSLSGTGTSRTLRYRPASGWPTREVNRRVPATLVGLSRVETGRSIRDIQFKHSIAAGKNFHATGGFGPWIITADEIPDPTRLHLVTRLNGEEVQHTGIDDLIFDIPTLISYCSDWTPLVAGDVISTGTPEGVGFARKPPRWMKPGDVVEVEIDGGIGVLRNPIIAES
jgi:Fumarylacetoacetate (FAA) hydrolase family